MIVNSEAVKHARPNKKKITTQRTRLDKTLVLGGYRF